MFTNNRLRIEFALLAIFFLSACCVLFKIPHATVVAVTSGGLVSFLYFYAAFWLYAQSGMPVISRKIAGFCYSINIIACTFLLLRWPFGNVYAMISVAGLALMSTICIVNYKKPGYRAQLYRCAFFLVALIALYWLRYLHGAPAQAK